MTALSKVLESLRSWKLWVGVVVLVAVAGGGYYGYGVWTDSSAEEEEGQTQLVPVTRGDLVNDVSVTGTLTYTTRETLTFSQQGTVAEVAAAEGDIVSAGDPLAVLDAETVANLEKTIAQARVDVRAAEDALEDARSPYTAVQIAQAKSDEADARQALQDAQEELSDLGVVAADQLAQARLDVLSAQADLETAIENKATLATPANEDVVRAEADVTAARVALKDAKDALDTLLNPDSEEIDDRIAELQADIDSAEETIVTERLDLEAAERNAEDMTQPVADDLDTAQADYNDLFMKWLGMDVTPMAGESPGTIFAAHDIDLETIFEGPRTEEMQQQFFRGELSDDPETPWDELIVMSWVALYLGEILVDCESDDAGPSRYCVTGEFDDAYEAIVELIDNLQTVEAEESEKIWDATVALSNAEDTLKLRQQDLEDYLAEIDEELDSLDVEAAQAAVVTAEADLLDAETALAELMQPADLDIGLADREIELARAMLADAEESLASLLEDPDPIDLLVKQAAVNLALESLADAEATLEEYNAVDQLDIELKQAEVVAAQATLETATADLESATLRAPFDGIVVVVNIESGEQVNANTEAIEIADPSVVEVSGSVDEIDVLFLQEGARAAVNLEALGTQALLGTVSSIATIGTSQQGVVTYPVTIRVESSANNQLPEGLSATAQVVIREQTDSLLIPLQALYGSVQSPIVRVVNGENITERQVSLGISDDFWIVVEDGLAEGEFISMEVVGSSTSQFGGIGATFRAVGGFGGRGGGPPRGGGGP